MDVLKVNLLDESFIYFSYPRTSSSVKIIVQESFKNLCHEIFANHLLKCQYYKKGFIQSEPSPG